MPDAVMRDGWCMRRFEEMAAIVNDRIDNPSEAGVDRYVGLEHLDSGSLIIRRWGSPEDVHATKLRFRRGDIIFGRRRAYQRKLAVADFDGICSAHAMVLRARPEVVLPEFLPFLMQSAVFMERAKEISVGSLSPTINWKTLANEQFVLPPLPEQRRIAELLQASESARQRFQSAAGAVETVALSWLHSRLRRIHKVQPLGEVLSSIEYGCSTRANTHRDGVPILRIPNVLRGLLELSDLKWVRLSADETANYTLYPGDILIVRTNGNPDYVGRCLVVPELAETTVFASYLMRLIVDPSKVRPEYVVSVLNSPSVRRQLRSSVRSSAGNFNINTSGIRNALVPIPSLAEQDSILANMARFTEVRSLFTERTQELSAIQRLLIKGLEL